MNLGTEEKFEPQDCSSVSKFIPKRQRYQVRECRYFRRLPSPNIPRARVDRLRPLSDAGPLLQVDCRRSTFVCPCFVIHLQRELRLCRRSVWSLAISFPFGSCKTKRY